MKTIKITPSWKKKKNWGTTTGMLTQLLPDKQLEVPLEQEKKKCE